MPLHHLPTPRLDFRADASRAFDVLRGGGIAILPMDVGYSLIGGSTAALARIFDTKRRSPSKLNAMLGNADICRDVALLTAEQREIVEAITLDHDLPLGLVAPVRLDHPLLGSLDGEGLSRSTRAGTVCMLLNAGGFHEEICRLSLEHLHPLFGSSANRSLQGTKFRVEDIEKDIADIADIVIDYGLRKYHPYRASSTILDISTLDVLRAGSCFELIADVLKRQFGHEVGMPGRNPPPARRADAAGPETVVHA